MTWDTLYAPTDGAFFVAHTPTAAPYLLTAHARAGDPLTAETRKSHGSRLG